MSQLLSTKIASVRRKQSVVAAARGGAAMVAAIVLLFAFGMLTDWWLELPRIVRTAFIAVDVTALTYLFLWHVLFPILFGPDDEAVALLVERSIPEFRTRLIASVQLSRPGAIPAGSSPAIVRAMIAQTESMADPLEFADVVRIEPAIKLVSLAVVILGLGIGSFVWGNDVASDLLKRVFLSDIPVPRDTRVECRSGNVLVPIGESVKLEAHIRGIRPLEGRVDVEYASGRKQRFTVEQTKGDGDTFARTIENVQESFKYRIYVNDGRTQWHKVEALPRPAVTGVRFHQTYPAYTKHKDEARSPGDLSCLVGSKLRITAEASKPIAEAAIRLVGLEREVPMTIGGANRGEVTGTIDIPPKGLSGVSLRLKDDHGIWSRGETVYPIDLIPDKDPTIRIIWPDRKEELATRQAKLLVSFEATDDFGIAQVVIWHKYDTDDSNVAKSIELSLADQSDTRTVFRRYEFDLGKITPLPPEGSTVEYWVEIRDGNNVTGPGRAVSEHYKARIVNELEKSTELMNRANDQLSTIDFVTDDQEKLTKKLGALILEKR